MDLLCRLSTRNMKEYFWEKPQGIMLHLVKHTSKQVETTEDLKYQNEPLTQQWFLFWLLEPGLTDYHSLGLYCKHVSSQLSTEPHCCIYACNRNFTSMHTNRESTGFEGWEHIQNAPTQSPAQSLSNRSGLCILLYASNNKLLSQTSYIWLFMLQSTLYSWQTGT